MCRGINVNALAPGFFETDLTTDLKANPDSLHAANMRIPQGRWGKPEDLRGGAIFLASKASDYVNGAIISVDGGYLGR